MKRWYSRDSVTAKVGIVAIVFLIAAGISVSMRHPVQHATQLSTAPASQSSNQQNLTPVSEKPKAPVIQTQVETSEEDIPYSTTQTYDGTLPKDTTVVRVDGANGKKIVKTEVKTKDGVEISRELISEEVTVPPVAKVVAIGTKVVPKNQVDVSSCDPHYSPCVPKSTHDIDCSDLGYQVTVVNPGSDPDHLDQNGDGIGCENYPAVNQ